MHTVRTVANTIDFLEQTVSKAISVHSYEFGNTHNAIKIITSL